MRYGKYVERRTPRVKSLSKKRQAARKEAKRKKKVGLRFLKPKCHVIIKGGGDTYIEALGRIPTRIPPFDLYLNSFNNACGVCASSTSKSSQSRRFSLFCLCRRHKTQVRSKIPSPLCCSHSQREQPDCIFPRNEDAVETI